MNGLQAWCRRISAALAISLCALCTAGQELRCEVQVDASLMENSSRADLERLQEAITEYMNSASRTQLRYAPGERLECRLYLTPNSYENGVVKGDLQVQLTRPVYGSVYTTPLFNFKDTKVEFEYRSGDALVYSETGGTGNLAAILDFYTWLFLAIDADSFAPMGGADFYDRAAEVVQRAQSGGDSGWRLMTDNRNRAALLGAFSDANMKPMREFLYTYHRLGLDQMSSGVAKGREEIGKSLENLEKLAAAAPMGAALTIVHDTKLDELINIYSLAPAAERDKVMKMLMELYPADSERLRQVMNQSQRN